MMRTLGVAAFALSLTAYAPANATVLTGTITYYQMPETGDPDFGNSAFCCGAHYSNEVKSTLGSNGLPVYSGNGYGGPNLSDVNPITGELTWWSSTSTGSQPFSTPYDQHLFTTNGAGTNDLSAFQTAIFTANLTGGTKYTFTFGGDDDVFLAVGNKVIGQDGGVHAFSNSGGQFNTVSYTTSGPEVLTVFFADRYNVESEFYLSVTAVPEASTWAMMILGFLGVGFLAYRRSPGSALRVA
jgi:fibro-slime domain-containing protein